MSEKYKLDLSDGFGTEDIGGILLLFFNLIKAIFTVILYPYVWIWRMTSRALSFIRIKDQKDTPLNNVQIRFIESLPMYFILTGFFVGILMSIIMFLNDASDVTDFLNSLSIDAIIGLIYDILAFILEVILWIIGLDTTVGTGATAVKTERFGILDILRIFFIEFLFEMFTNDPVLTFLGAGFIGLVLVVVYIILSETETVIKFFGSLKRFLFVVLLSPRKMYNRLDTLFININKYLANIVIGRNRLDERNIGFHKKITAIIFAFGLYTFISGIVVLMTSETTDVVQKMTFFVIVLLVFGLGVGILGLWIVVRILDKISKKSGKYKEITKA